MIYSFDRCLWTSISVAMGLAMLAPTHCIAQVQSPSELSATNHDDLPAYTKLGWLTVMSKTQPAFAITSQEPSADIALEGLIVAPSDLAVGSSDNLSANLSQFLEASLPAAGGSVVDLLDPLASRSLLRESLDWLDQPIENSAVKEDPHLLGISLETLPLIGDLIDESGNFDMGLDLPLSMTVGNVMGNTGLILSTEIPVD